MSIQKLNRLIVKMKGLDAFIVKAADDVVNKTSKVLVDENRRQMKSGLDTLNLPIEYQKQRIGETGSYGWYSKGYQKYKEKRGGNTMYVDLYLSGEFNKSIGLFQDNPGRFRFISEDEKYNYLVVNYGDKILGVTEEFLDFYSKFILEYQLQEKVDKFLQI